jgi:hypothetical protein
MGTYTAEQFLEEINAAWDKIGRHPNVLIEFDHHGKKIKLGTRDGGNLPRIYIPVPARPNAESIRAGVDSETT